MSEPEIALLMSTYQRPGHLRRALQSIALQQGVDGKMELVVTDDGSTDETPQIVAEFARRAPFRVGFTTHPHASFQLSRSRNEGVKASTAPYILFLDGDCILPPDHVRIHLERRKPACVMAGDFCRLDRETSAQVSDEVIRSGEFQAWAPKRELRRLLKKHYSSGFYRLIRHPRKPKLIGNNVGIWRSDLLSVNGYDENFVGWGCEDDDLRLRLRAAGVRIHSILRWTHTYHLWHPTDKTTPRHWREGANVGYLMRKGRLTRCRNGVEKRGLEDLSIRIVGRSSRPDAVARLLDGRLHATGGDRPEVELLFLPGQGRFSGQAECNVVVSLEPRSGDTRSPKGAHLTIAPKQGGHVGRAEFSPADFEKALLAAA